MTSLSFRSGFVAPTLMFLLLAAPAPEARADIHDVVPSLAVRQEFNDNVFLSVFNPRSDFITTVSPALSLVRRDERLNGSLSLGANYLHYWRTDELDGTDLFGQAALSYRTTPLVTLTLGGGYLSDSRPDRIDEAGFAVTAGSEKYNGQTGFSWQVNERDTLGGSYSYVREEFDNGLLLPTTTHGVSLNFTHDVGRYIPRTKVGTSVQFTRNDVTTSTVDNYSASLTLTRSLHEAWTVSANLGGRYTHAAYRVGGGERRNDDTGIIGSLNLAYGGDLTNGSLAFVHDLTTSTGRASVTERTGVTAQLGTRFTEELSGRMSAGWFYNRSDADQFAAAAVDETTYQVNGTLSYALNRFLDLSGTYQYKRVLYGVPNLDTTQNMVTLGLSARYPLFE